jgi:hypothetical protein
MKTDKRDRECCSDVQTVLGADLVGYFGLQDGRKLVTLAVTFHDIVVDWCGL